MKAIIVSFSFLIMAESIIAQPVQVGIGFPSQLFTQRPPLSGDSEKGEAFNRYSESHIQQIYSAAEFAKVAPEGAWIWEVSFVSETYVAGGLSGLQVSFGTTDIAVGGLDPVFASNLSQEMHIARTFVDFTGGETLSGSSFHLGVFKPYFYDPRKGNLLLDVHTKGMTMDVLLDYHTRSDGTISSVFGFADLGAHQTLPDRGMPSLGGFVTSIVLDFSYVPEPDTLGLAALGGLAVAGMARRRKTDEG